MIDEGTETLKSTETEVMTKINEKKSKKNEEKSNRQPFLQVRAKKVNQLSKQVSGKRINSKTHSHARTSSHTGVAMPQGSVEESRQ